MQQVQQPALHLLVLSIIVTSKFLYKQRVSSTGIVTCTVTNTCSGPAICLDWVPPSLQVESKSTPIKHPYFQSNRNSILSKMSNYGTEH
jgi:hypothetical protein